MGGWPATVTAIGIALVAGGGVAAQSLDDFVPLFTDSLKGWAADRNKAAIKGGVVTLDGGWLTLHEPLANFVARMEIRQAGADVRAGIVVRTWRTFNAQTGVPDSAYVIVAGDGGAPGEPIGSIVEYGQNGLGRRFTPSARPDVDNVPPSEGWHRYEIECVDDTITVTVDGNATSKAAAVLNTRGFFGFSVAAGAIQLRNVALRRLQDSARTLPDGVYSVKDVVMPRALREVKPRYTREALSRRIAGVVLVETIIDREGRPTQLKIIRSLDPHFGLDDEAVKAASQWRFRPGTKDGQPVPVLVMIELTFTVKQ